MVRFVKDRDRSLEVVNSLSPLISLVSKDCPGDSGSREHGGCRKLVIGRTGLTMQPRSHISKHAFLFRLCCISFPLCVFVESFSVSGEPLAWIAFRLGKSSIQIVRIKSIVEITFIRCLPPPRAWGVMVKSDSVQIRAALTVLRAG